MKFYKAENYEGMSRKAAEMIAEQVKAKNNCVLGLATGSTPVGTYKQLVDWYNKGELSFASVNSGLFPFYRK